MGGGEGKVRKGSKYDLKISEITVIKLVDELNVNDI